jgi:octaprenyl-diphosphate synthase
MPPTVGPTPGTPPRDLPTVLAPLEPDLERVGAAFREILSAVSWRTRDMVSQAGRFGGKRLRPALTVIAARYGGGTVTPEVASVAAIVELIHVATLVHDDVLDGAEVRRRIATVNARWGNPTAVLVGDVLFSRAYLAAARLEDRFASRYLSEVVGEVLEGEIHQDMVCRNPDLSEDDYRGIIRGKTAALYEGAMVVGAHYGGRPHLKGPLGRFGHHLGMAFQMVDDRLDLTGDESTVGKTLGRDLGEGKTTLPVILWLRDRPASDRAASRALVESAWDDPVAAQTLCARLARDGALARAASIAEAEVRQAFTHLEGLPSDGLRDLLETVSRFVLERHR